LFLGLQTLLLVSGRMPSKLPVIMIFVTKIACLRLFFKHRSLALECFMDNHFRAKIKMIRLNSTPISEMTRSAFTKSINFKKHISLHSMCIKSLLQGNHTSIAIILECR
jgi:hypothetical protein